MLPDSADLLHWRAGLAGLSARWAAIDAAVAAPAIDWRAVEADLTAAARVQADLVAAGDRLLAAAVAALGSLRSAGWPRWPPHCARYPRCPKYG